MHKAGAFYAPALDGLRAIAFGMVFLSHVPGLWFFPGGFGVTVFFFLSGYLITTLLRLEWEQAGRIDLWHFYVRRFLRILPPYLLTLAAVSLVALLGGFKHEVWWPSVAWQAGFGANIYLVLWGPQGLLPGSEVTWSLAVEEHFYLVFPWVMVGLLRVTLAKHRAAALLAACTVVLIWRTVLFVGLSGNVDRLTYATDTRIDSILFGCVLALWNNPALDPPQDWVRNRPLTVFWAAAALLVLTLAPRDPAFRETVRYTLQGLLLFPVYVVLIARPDVWPARLLALPWMRTLGALSYTLYLVHHSAIALVRNLAPSTVPALVVGGVALALSLGYASAMHRLVERPLARWRARMRHGPSVSADPARQPKVP